MGSNQIKLFVVLFLVPFYLWASNERFEIKQVASNLGGAVWGMTFINDNELLFTLKSGEIKKLQLNTSKVTSIHRVDNLFYEGQGGLLDIQISPKFALDKQLYITYVKSKMSHGATTLAVAKLEGNRLVNWKDLLVTKSVTQTTAHFGSRVTFDTSGHLYFSVGDRGVRPNSQDLTNHAGTVMRLNLDGTVPRDNPFVNKSQALDEIYSYGHRNPQGVFFDKIGQKLFVIEHGPRGGDEINLIKAGANYGWPVISYGKEYWNPLHVGEGTHKEGMEQPIKYYVPSIAPSSLIVYNGDVFSSWKGSIFSGALKMRHLNRIVLNDKNEVIKEERLLEDLGERIRNVVQSPKGNLFISTDSGAVYKLFKP